MILDSFPKVLWINLKTSEARRNRMSSLLDSYNIQHTRLEAVDGSLSWPYLGRLALTNKMLTTRETGCTLSHLYAIKYFYTEILDETCVILEDDTSFEFLEYVPYDWSSFISSLPEDWRVVQLAVSELVPSIKTELVKLDSSSKRYCSSAYLINKQGAKDILDRYFDPRINMFNLSHISRPTSDYIICHTSTAYSIPLFTYLCDESTIHPSHLSVHEASKKHQMDEWIMMTQ